MIAFLPATCPSSDATYISLIACVSQAVSPTNTSTPITEMANCSAEEAMNMLTIEAMMMPISPMIRNEPNRDRSRRVV